MRLRRLPSFAGVRRASQLPRTARGDSQYPSASAFCDALLPAAVPDKNIQITTSEDRQTVRIDVPETQLTLNAVDVDNLLLALASARAALLPEHPMDPQQNREYQAIANPRYWVMPNQVLGGVNLGFRHPGVGWMWYCMQEGDTEHLVQALNDHSAKAPAEGSQAIN
jgi:hypothetical protein